MLLSPRLPAAPPPPAPSLARLARSISFQNQLPNWRAGVGRSRLCFWPPLSQEEIGGQLCEVGSSLPTFAWVLVFELRSSDLYSKSFAPSVSVDGDLGSVRPKCTFLPPSSLYWAPFIFTNAVTYSSSAGFFPYTRLALEEQDGGGVSGIPGGRTEPEAPPLESPEVLRMHIGEGWRLLAETLRTGFGPVDLACKPCYSNAKD
ncbi:uncharacterized protein LOC113456345 [Microtus ochrogaster]|uniref:Uncharacterized protein LOC113456345 n=1 Tax=Microtus ochrogaster TaxID=79684 RepID=A0ABM1U435_MICOH|nr:uncharacterized protein LOC113456345 [Microtus ochrogaster]